MLENYLKGIFYIIEISSKVKATWNVVIEGIEHVIVAYHSQISGRKSVLLDSEVFYEDQDMTYFGIDFEFPVKIEGRVVGVVVESHNIGWNYEIYIDGYSMEKLNKKRADLALSGVYSSPVSKVQSTEEYNKKKIVKQEPEEEEEEEEEEEDGEEEEEEE